jgi:hypothetical protein
VETVKYTVSRTIEAGNAKTERSTVVSFRNATTVAEALELSGGSQADFLKIFNNGRWADLRTKVSNTLAGTSESQRAVNKMIKAMQVLQPQLSEEAVRSLVLSMPGLSDAAASSASPLPAEIDDTYNFGASAEAAPEVPAAA